MVERAAVQLQSSSNIPGTGFVNSLFCCVMRMAAWLELTMTTVQPSSTIAVGQWIATVPLASQTPVTTPHIATKGHFVTEPLVAAEVE